MSKKKTGIPLIAWTAGASALTAYWYIIRPWMSRWGATQEELERVLPGDDLVPQPRMGSTLALTIHAPAREVWLWLVQIGYKRAGWYSYDWLHRLIGVAGSVDHEERSAWRIIPELQDLKAGDIVEIAPDMGYTVLSVEPQRTLLLHAAFDMQSFEAFDLVGPKPEQYLNSSWLWFLDPIDEGRTRLIARIRQDYNPSLTNALMIRGLIEPGSFIMQRRSLLGIKERAETLG